MAHNRSALPGIRPHDPSSTWKEKLGDCHDVLRQITETVQSVSKQMESLETGINHRSPLDDVRASKTPPSPPLLPQTTINIGSRTVSVTAAVDMDLDKVINAVPFKDWVEKVGKNSLYVVKSVIIQSVDMFGPKVGFLKFKADVEVEGKFTPGIVFMRGGAVAVLVLLKCEGQLFALMVKQHRVPICETFFPEVPAGMLDGDGNFGGVAAKELKEETGIQINQSDLIDMTALTYGNKFKGMYPSCGGSDEFNRLFLYRKDVTREQMNEYQGKLTGLAEEGESIVLQVIPYEELWTTSPDAKALCAICLYEKLMQCKKISPS